MAGALAPVFIGADVLFFDFQNLAPHFENHSATHDEIREIFTEIIVNEHSSLWSNETHMNHA